MAEKKPRRTSNVSAAVEQIQASLAAGLQKCLDNCDYDGAVLWRRTLDASKAASAKSRKKAAAKVEPMPAAPAPVQEEPVFVGTMYRVPDCRFTREQLTFIADAVLSSAFDRIESALPPSTCLASWPSVAQREAYLGACLDLPGVALPVIWAQLNNDGMELNAFAGYADWVQAVETYVRTSLEHDPSPKATREELEQFVQTLRTVRPDLRKIAEQHVVKDYDEYLQGKDAKDLAAQWEELSANLEEFTQEIESWAARGKESAGLPDVKPSLPAAGKDKDSIVPAVPLVAFTGDPFDAVLAELDEQLQAHWEMARPHLTRPEYRSGVAGGIRDARYVLNAARVRLKMLTAAVSAAKS
jgi:hypothetical protein